MKCSTCAGRSLNRDEMPTEPTAARTSPLHRPVCAAHHYAGGVKAQAWTALAAWAALAISLLNLWYTVLRAWFRERKASPAAQLDLLSYQSKSGATQEVRVVVTNHGPALMKKVDVQVFDEDGMSLALSEPDVTSLWPKMPVERLHLGQSLYLTLNRSAATRTPHGALIRWRDGRKEEQSRWVHLSYNRVV